VATSDDDVAGTAGLTVEPDLTRHSDVAAVDPDRPGATALAAAEPTTGQKAATTAKP
jgi:hypothetical protein